MNVCCIPTKQLYSDRISGFRVLSCRPKNPWESPIPLNKYNNFTISGNNLNGLQIGDEYELDLEPDKSSKYPASYRLRGYSGLVGGETIEVDPRQEMSFLCQAMERRQASNVHKAYKNFVSLVLNGRESEIDVKKIYNVGDVRLKLYIKKIKQNLRAILFCPVCNEWGLIDFSKVEKLATLYDKPEELAQAFLDDPYHIFCDFCEYSFRKADKIIIEKHPELTSSLCRCKAGCMEILRENETQSGDTRINSNILARFVNDLVPECKPYIVEAVKDNPLIHYDEATKDSAIKQTYDDECTIAEAIKDRVKYPMDDCMEWEKFKDVTGFSCTDEQAEILRLASSESVAILTGSAGSGKSSAMRSLIIMLEHYQKSYLQLSPTGTAAKRLRETTGRKASTIHMYLASEVGAVCDYVLVDEFSMVGVNLMASLIRTLPPTTKLIFVCDNAQLASISCGNLVQDILDSGIVKRANLTKVFRYDSSGLARIATDTRNGVPLDTSLKFDDYKFIPAKDPIEQCVAQYEEYLTQGYKKQEIMILCPYNKSHIGSYVINEAIQEKFNANDFCGVEHKIGSQLIKYKIGDMVINKKNNYHMPLYTPDEYSFEEDEPCDTFVANGDIGTIRDVGGTEDKPYLVVEFDCGLCKVEGSDIQHLLLGYCISIHSSQGSQAKAVIVVIDKSHKNLLSRNLLYVGLSRSQEKMILIADKDVVNEALEVQEEKSRDTYLKDLLLTNTSEYDIMNEESEGD